MPLHQETVILPYSSKQIFDLVADVGRYAEFLPWCRASRVLECKDQTFLGELVVCYANLCESYTSQVILTPYKKIDVTMVKGPFEYLTNQWCFFDVPEGTKIDFSLDFKFRSRMLEHFMGGFFTKATSKMVQAFHERAKELYGS